MQIFDQILINEAAGQGEDVRFGHAVTSFDNGSGMARLGVQPENGAAYEIQAHFVLDASGYGRVLPRLPDLATPSCLPVREAYFTHIDDHIGAPEFDCNKILISTHPQPRDVWSPILPGRFAGLANSEAILCRYAGEVPMLVCILDNALWEKFSFLPIRPT